MILPNVSGMEFATTVALPRSQDLPAVEKRALTGAFVLLLILLTVTAANAVFGLGGPGVYDPIRDWVSSAIYVVVAAIVLWRAIRIEPRRAAWWWFGIGLTLYALGNVLWSMWLEHEPNPPIPSVCDVLWLSFYPLAYVGIWRRAASSGEPRPSAGVWMDGVIAGAGLAALGAALVFHQVLAGATGGPVAVATELAYPIADLLLAALVVGVMAMRGWWRDRGWTMLVGGFLMLAGADCLYAVQVAAGSSRPSPLTNLAYVLSVAVLAFASWQSPPRHGVKRASWSMLVLPCGFLIAALGVLLYDHVHRLNALAFGLATLTLIAAMVRMVLAFHDIRGLVEARRLAATDDLTALPNRRLFLQRVEDAVAATALSGDRVSVLMLDLDNFKELNDTLGHHAGDALLRQIGPRLVTALRETDTVARLGGDEFAVLLEPAPDDAGLARVARTMLAALNEPFEIHGVALRVTGSVGIASYPTDARDVGALMQYADIAMYQAKASRSGFDFYALERDTNSPERLAIAGELAAALERSELEVHFQPIASARNRRIVAAEALVRWRQADGRLVPPAEFIVAAEHAGLARQLTRRVMQLSLDQLAGWRARGHALSMAINTTVADLLDADFPAEVAAALADRGLPPQALTLEVTESLLLSDPQRVGEVLAELRRLGIGLALDDFGTGYSSLVHLRSLPVDVLKIDRVFVSRMCEDPRDAAIVQSMIQLGLLLGMRIVAEGVEDERTWRVLGELGCGLIQGFTLSRPCSPTTSSCCSARPDGAAGRSRRLPPDAAPMLVAVAA